jgi:hypothetical protein
VISVCSTWFNVKELYISRSVLTDFFRISLWSSGQTSWLQIQRSRVRFPALPDFLRSSESGMGSTQPREDNWGATWKESSGSGLETEMNGRGDPLRWPRDILYPLKWAITSPTSGGRSVGIVRWRIKALEFFFVFLMISIYYFPKKHWPAALCNAGEVWFLQNFKIIFWILFGISGVKVLNTRS